MRRGNLENYHDKADKLAERHVDWLMDLFNQVCRPLMKEEFIHGFKHGLEEKANQSLEPDA